MQVPLTFLKNRISLLAQNLFRLLFVSAEMALQHIKFETRYDDFHPVVRRTLSTAFTLRTDLSEVTFGH